MGATHRTADEFSDESLFGEDRIEDLIEKKNSFQKSTQNLLIGAAESSFRSKQGGLTLMRTQFGGGGGDEMNYSQQHTPAGASAREGGASAATAGNNNTVQRQSSTS